MVLPRCNGKRANFDQHKLRVMTNLQQMLYIQENIRPRFTFANFALDDNGRILRLSENKTAFKLLC